MVLKTKKKFLYIGALLSGFVLTLFTAHSDGAQNGVTKKFKASEVLLPEVQADVPYSQAYYQNTYQSGYGGDDNRGDGDGDADGDSSSDDGNADASPGDELY